MLKFARPAVGVAVAMSAILAASAAAAPKAPRSAYAKPVRLTPTTGLGGFEPSVIVDHSNNVWVTAHKTYYGAISPDSSAALKSRSGSWLWMSHDGVHFTDPAPGDALGTSQQYIGDEGDLAVDNANNVYWADLGHTASSLNSWKVAKDGSVQHTLGTPRVATIQSSADRPFIAAGGDGTVLFLQNQLRTTADMRSQTDVYVSRDGGKSFSTPSITTPIPNSQFCRPLVDQRNSANMVITCEDGDAGVFSISSSNYGKTWSAPVVLSSTVGSHFRDHAIGDFPSVAQGADGSVYALYMSMKYGDDPSLDPVAAQLYNGVPNSTNLYLFRSRDLGKTWTTQNITPAAKKGIWLGASIATSPNGQLGLSGYYRPRFNTPWQLFASTFTPGIVPTVAEPVPGLEIAPPSYPTPDGDFSQATFGRDGKFRIVYNVSELTDAPKVNLDSGGKAGSATVYYVQQR